MNEEQILSLLKSINIKIEALQAQMIMFQEALNPSLEYIDKEFDKFKKTKVEEEVVKKKPKKLKKTHSTGKIEAGAHRISTTTCTTCGGFISWDMRPERNLPLHVDENGHIKGTGDCPEWEEN